MATISHAAFSIAFYWTKMFFHKGLIGNIPSLVRIIGWRRTGDKPLFEPMFTEAYKRQSYVDIYRDRQ